MTASNEASPPYRLIATDLDGTLLRDDETVSERSRTALRAATGAGAAHIVVTGRSVPATRHIFDALDYRGLAVCAQGAQVYHAGEDRLLTSVTLDRQLAALAVEKIEAETGPLAVAVGRDGADGDFLAEKSYEITKRVPAARLRDRDELWREPLAQLLIQHPELDDDELAGVARAAAGHLVDVVVSGERMVEFQPLGLNKATGLSIAARRLGIPARQTLAFGDMPNDIPMLSWSGHGVAMANAHAELRAVADEITASNQDDGIADVVERLFSL